MVTHEDAIAVLNRIHEADPTVMPTLVHFRVPCNNAVADDQTVQVYSRDGTLEVGLLGILNGIFGTREDGKGYIAAFRDENGDITQFCLTP